MNKYKECWKWPWNNHVALAKPVRNLCVHAFEILSTSAKGHLFALHWNKASLESISSKGWGDWKDVLGFGIMQSWESQIAKLYSLLTPTGIMEACHRIILKKNYEMRKTDWFILYLIDRVWYRISWCVQSEKGKPSQVLSPAVDSVRLPEHVFFLGSIARTRRRLTSSASPRDTANAVLNFVTLVICFSWFCVIC